MPKVIIQAISLLLCLTASSLFAKVDTLNLWQGEYFQAKEGAFYFVIGSHAASIDPASQVSVTLINRVNRSTYVLSQKVDVRAERAMPIWKAPSGKYSIEAITLVDRLGKKRMGRISGRNSFVIKRFTLSNLGTWHFTVAPTGEISGTINPTPNIYKEAGSKQDSSLSAVIGGFDGLVQEVLGGSKVFKKAKQNFGTTDEMRASYTIRRQIAMYHSLNLFQHNYYAREISDTLNAYDAQLRECYTDALDESGDLRGTVQFKFLLSKKTGSMARITHGGGSLTNPKMVKCLYDQLAGASFAAKANMIGELIFTFDFNPE
jgi:hypothetical protein